MGIRHGKEGVVKVGGVTIGEVQSWTLKESVPTVDATAQGDTAAKHLVGVPMWEGSLECTQDKADAGQEALTIGAEVELDLYDDGTGSGQKYHSGTATVTEIGRSIPVGDKITRSFTFLGKEALTHPTI